MSELTHFDDSGHAHMVDVGGKQVTARKAVAEGWIHMHADTLALIVSGEHKKGDVIAVARLAGIMAAKRTADLIPLCHPLMLTNVTVDVTTRQSPPAVHVIATTQTHERTGVEMEALTSVQIALLTVYDMCKAVDRGMTIDGVRLLEKIGGKSGHWRREDGTE